MWARSLSSPALSESIGRIKPLNLSTFTHSKFSIPAALSILFHILKRSSVVTRPHSVCLLSQPVGSKYSHYQRHGQVCTTLLTLLVSYPDNHPPILSTRLSTSTIVQGTTNSSYCGDDCNFQGQVGVLLYHVGRTFMMSIILPDSFSGTHLPQACCMVRRCLWRIRRRAELDDSSGSASPVTRYAESALNAQSHTQR